jgi:phosphonate transport system substrate-binding protein
MRFLIRQFAASIVAMCLLCNGANAGCLGDQSVTKVHTFDVVPQLTAAKIYATWSPLLQRVGQETGMCFDLRGAPTIPEFEQRLLKGESDFHS